MIALALAASLALPPGKPAGVRKAMHEQSSSIIYLGIMAGGATAIWLVMDNGKSAPVTTGTAP